MEEWNQEREKKHKCIQQKSNSSNGKLQPLEEESTSYSLFRRIGGEEKIIGK